MRLGSEKTLTGVSAAAATAFASSRARRSGRRITGSGGCFGGRAKNSAVVPPPVEGALQRHRVGVKDPAAARQAEADPGDLHRMAGGQVLGHIVAGGLALDVVGQGQ